MSTEIVTFAENLSVVSNVTELTIKALQQVGASDDVEINAATRELLIKRIHMRLAHNVRVQSVVK